MEQVFIIGGSNESMNAGILLASLNKQVNFICHQTQIDETLTHYQFERQMVSLWDLYCKEQKICVLDGMLVHRALLQQESHAVVWLFLDALTADELIEFFHLLTSPHQQILLSGFTPIGQADEFAKQFFSQWVFYLPFTFMKDGENFSSLLHPDVVLVGEKTANSYQKCEILLFFLQNANRHYFSDIKTVEFARASMMTMLATRVSLMNELSSLADQLQVNITKVQAMMGLDRRIGKHFLAAGWGFGGKTLPLELSWIDTQFADHRLSHPLIQAVQTVNDHQKELLFRKFWQHFDGFIDGKTVVIWGAGYRAGTGRTTHSAIHALLRLLWSYEITTQIYSPNAGAELSSLYDNQPLLSFIDDAYELSLADALFVVNWSDVLPPDVARLNQFAVPIFDGKNLFSDEQIAQLSSVYCGVGRHSSLAK